MAIVSCKYQGACSTCLLRPLVISGVESIVSHLHRCLAIRTAGSCKNQEVSSGIEQHPHHLQVAILSCKHQGGCPVLQCCILVSSSLLELEIPRLAAYQLDADQLELEIPRLAAYQLDVDQLELEIPRLAAYQLDAYQLELEILQSPQLDAYQLELANSALHTGRIELEKVASKMTMERIHLSNSVCVSLSLSLSRSLSPSLPPSLYLSLSHLCTSARSLSLCLYIRLHYCSVLLVLDDSFIAL